MANQYRSSSQALSGTTAFSPQLSGSSSPDPLLSSPMSIQQRRSSPTRQSLSPSKTTPSKNLKLHDLTIRTPPRNNPRRQSSPTRAQSTSYVTSQPLPDGASPWRIRVTVEAEPESEAENIYEDKYSRMQTKTVKVPLRGGEDEESDAIKVSSKSRRTRYEEQNTMTNAAMTSPIKGRKRSATPARTRGASKTRRKSLTDLDIVVLGDDSDDPDARPRRRKSRARKSPKKARTSQNQAERIDSVEESSAGRMQTRIGKQEDAIFDIAADRSVAGEQDVQDHPAAEDDVLSPLRSIDLNRVALRSRDPQTELRKHTEHTSIRNKTYPTPTSTPELDVQPTVPSQTLDPTEEHHEFDSILESEGFTMISLDSIPSARYFVSSPLESVNEQPPASSGSTRSSKATSATYAQGRWQHLESPLDGASKVHSSAKPSQFNDDSEISSTMPSSPPSEHLSPTQYTRQHRTPELAMSSPQLPSPPKGLVAGPIMDVEVKPTPPKLARVIRAGIALQGALSPKIKVEPQNSPLSKPAKEVSHVPAGSPKERLDRLFDGFESGTRRELRAGLCLNEELIRRQSRATSLLDASQAQRRETPVTPAQRTIYRAGPDTVFAQREREWQFEREAISRQIEMANASQVIVIQSDDDPQGRDPENTNTANHEVGHCEEEQEDIWLQEAHNSSQNSDQLNVHRNRNESRPLQMKRRTIPSPWKRGEDVDQSTFISNVEMSGIFWQPPARVIPVRSSSSGVHIPEAKSPEKPFDLAALLGVRSSPRKIAFEKEQSHHIDEEEDSQASARAMPVKSSSSGLNIPEAKSPEKPFELAALLGVSPSPRKVTFETEQSHHDEEEEEEEEVEENQPTDSRGVRPEQILHLPLALSHNRSREESLEDESEPEYGSEEQSMSATVEDGERANLSSAYDGDSSIPVVKVPVNFGDESSLTQGHSVAATDCSVYSDASVQGLEAVQETPSVPTPISSGGTNWVGRLANLTLTWSGQAHGRPANAAQETRDRLSSDADCETELEYQPVSTLVFPAVDSISSRAREVVAKDRQPTSYGEAVRGSKLRDLDVSGPWTKDHYRALHRLYLKSINRKTPKILDIRPRLQQLLDQTALSGTGSHAYQVKMTGKELSVVEEFMRSLEGGAGRSVGWKEEDLAMRLYSIIIGHQERRQKAARAFES